MWEQHWGQRSALGECTGPEPAVLGLPGITKVIEESFNFHYNHKINRIPIECEFRKLRVLGRLWVCDSSLEYVVMAEPLDKSELIRPLLAL